MRSEIIFVALFLFVCGSNAHLCILSPPQRGPLYGLNTPGKKHTQYISDNDANNVQRSEALHKETSPSQELISRSCVIGTIKFLTF